MLWKVWRFVCREIHEGGTRTHKPTEEECEVLWENYQWAWSTQSSQQKLGVTCGKRQWERPAQGRFRVDVDVLFNPQENLYGVGIIIRDWEGKIRVARTRRTPPRSNVMIAEMMAVIDGLILSMEHQLRPTEIYTDSILTA